MGKTQRVLEGPRKRLVKVKLSDQRLAETGETHVVWLITQRR